MKIDIYSHMPLLLMMIHLKLMILEKYYFLIIILIFINYKLQSMGRMLLESLEEFLALEGTTKMKIIN